MVNWQLGTCALGFGVGRAFGCFLSLGTTSRPRRSILLGDPPKGGHDDAGAPRQPETKRRGEDSVEMLC